MGYVPPCFRRCRRTSSSIAARSFGRAASPSVPKNSATSSSSSSGGSIPPSLASSRSLAFEFLEGRGPPRTLGGAGCAGRNDLRKLLGGDRLDTSRGAGVAGWHRRRLTESERGTSSSSAADRMLLSTLVAVTQ